MKSGEILEVLADDQGFENDLPAWCKMSEEMFLGMEKEGNILNPVRKFLLFISNSIKYNFSTTCYIISNGVKGYVSNVAIGYADGARKK